MTTIAVALDIDNRVVIFNTEGRVLWCGTPSSQMEQLEVDEPCPTE
jgi:hypothetical protein